MAWTHLDTATVASHQFDLYHRDGLYMIRVDGLELMNGYNHESEDRLGEMAVSLCNNPHPHILLGGLGLGYTLGRIAQNLGTRGRIDVAEISAAVMGWYRQYLQAQFFEELPGNVTLHHADVAAMMQSGTRYDMIILDVDNGPQALSQNSNHFLYSPQGLQALWNGWATNGQMLLWSSFESAHFLERAVEAGYQASCFPQTLAGRETPFHYIYCLVKKG